MLCHSTHPPELAQTRGLHEEEQAEVLRKHGHEAQANKHLVREALEEHPDVQRFLEWKEKRQVRARGGLHEEAKRVEREASIGVSGVGCLKRSMERKEKRQLRC